MSKNPAKKIITAPRKNLPTAKHAAAPKFTTNPRNVSTFGLIPVAAIAPTILSSSHLLPVPIAPVSVAIIGGNNPRFFPLRASRYRTAGPQPFANRPARQSNLEARFAPLFCAISSFALTFRPSRLRVDKITLLGAHLITEFDRRKFLFRGVAALGATWTAAHWPAVVAAAEHARKVAASAENQKWEFFTPAEAKEVEAVASCIIPSDGTPGGREAGVVYFID